MLIQKYFIIFSLVFLSLAWAVPAQSRAGESHQAQEAQVKAALIFNFARFVEWPASDSVEPLVIGIYGGNSVAHYLESLVKGRTVGGQKAVLKYVKSIDDTTDVHFLFISNISEDDEQKVLQALKGRRVLTIGESVKFLDDGGIVRFVSKDNKVRFHISDQQAKSSGLRISSQLLKLADVVK